MENATRFTDPGYGLWPFTAEILVRCPACEGLATVTKAPDSDNGRTRRLTCTGCGHNTSWTAPTLPGGNGWSMPGARGPYDPYFHRPVWLRAGCGGGHSLWAYNVAHLDLLDRFIGAELRERGQWASCGEWTLIEALPLWMKAAKNRDELVRTIQRLRATLPG
ncbi:hypothetical protein [Actinoplanes palleronii]|uniref:Uncharacterized protein n=1 Tax=Actinoplanes palleronii TaxID=113570 RepID=A0ABQ4BN23_9ACTN|nr:hypothetical protein [Actinoplanes palleronii]GIE72012.1 hypothetical protein Apa02nite_081200 [Actinoplanes palleronii]